MKLRDKVIKKEAFDSRNGWGLGKFGTVTTYASGFEEVIEKTQHRHTLYQDVFSGLFFAELLGGEFPNCYGQGSTSKDAILSLKIRIYQLRNKKK